MWHTAACLPSISVSPPHSLAPQHLGEVSSAFVITYGWLILSKKCFSVSMSLGKGGGGQGNESYGRAM